MKYKIIFSPEAEQQLDDLFSNIASESGRARAESFVGSILTFAVASTRFLSAAHVGTTSSPVSASSASSAGLALALSSTTALWFLGIFYGGQDFEAAFREDTE